MVNARVGAGAVAGQFAGLLCGVGGGLGMFKLGAGAAGAVGGRERGCGGGDDGRGQHGAQGVLDHAWAACGSAAGAGAAGGCAAGSAGWGWSCGASSARMA